MVNKRFTFDSRAPPWPARELTALPALQRDSRGLGKWKNGKEDRGWIEGEAEGMGEKNRGEEGKGEREKEGKFRSHSSFKSRRL